MNGKKQKTNLAIILSAVLISSSVIPSFAAYEPVQKFKYQSEENTAIHDSSTDFITYTDTSQEANDTGITIHYNSQFTDMDGNTYKVDDVCLYKECEHSFSDGILTNHHGDSNGGCIVYYYNAQRCSKCDLIKIGSLIKKVTYAVCPH